MAAGVGLAPHHVPHVRPIPERPEPLANTRAVRVVAIPHHVVRAHLGLDASDVERSESGGDPRLWGFRTRVDHRWTMETEHEEEVAELIYVDP